ncbi:MAG: Gfo/Idh/MocA family protein [Acidimicrobiia bacterium]
MTIRLGLIGAGRWGLNVIRTINETDGVELKRLGSRNPRAVTFVPSGCEVSQDWREVATASDLDGVIITTPPALHAEMSTAAVEAGLPVMVEKPLTLSLEEAEKLRARVQEHSGYVFVDHTLLFHPAYIKLCSLAESLGAVERVMSVGGNKGPFGKQCPPFWDYAAHDLAMILVLLGESPSSVTGGVVESRETEDGYGEMGEAELTFPSGAKAEISTGNLRDSKIRRVEVSFEESVIVFDDLAVDKLVQYERDHEGPGKPIEIRAELPLTTAVTSFAGMIQGGDMSSTGSLDLGVEVVRILEQLSPQIRSRTDADTRG